MKIRLYIYKLPQNNNSKNYKISSTMFDFFHNYLKRFCFKVIWQIFVFFKRHFLHSRAFISRNLFQNCRLSKFISRNFKISGWTVRESLSRESLSRESLSHESLSRESLSRESLSRDSLSRDSLSRGSLSRESLSRKSFYE